MKRIVRSPVTGVAAALVEVLAGVHALRRSPSRTAIPTGTYEHLLAAGRVATATIHGGAGQITGALANGEVSVVASPDRATPDLTASPPGTGKTLRAVAGEAGVRYSSISGSDFVEMFVGVGAGRVRDRFEQAKANAAAIGFMDEIDAVGRHRGAGLGGGHDEREQTLNALLVEVDGSDARGGVILIAAANRPAILDPRFSAPVDSTAKSSPTAPTWPVGGGSSTCWPGGPRVSPAPTWPTSSRRPPC